MNDNDFILKSLKQLLIFFSAAIPAFAGLASLQIDENIRFLFILFIGISFISTLILLNKVYRLTKSKTDDLEIDKVSFLNNVGDVNRFYDDILIKGTQYFGQVLTSGHIINPKNDAYVKCLQNGGNGKRIILITSLHDILTAKRSEIHTNADIIMLSDDKKPLSQLSLPSITLTEDNLLILFSNTASNIKGRPILLDSSNSEISKGILIKFLNRKEREVVEKYFEFIIGTGKLLNIIVNDLEHIKLLLYKNDPHKYKLDVVSAIAKDVISICNAKADNTGGSSDYLKYIGIIGSYAKSCDDYYKNKMVSVCNDIDLLVVFKDSLNKDILDEIKGKINDIIDEFYIKNEIVFELEDRIAPIKMSLKNKNEVLIHLICVPETSLQDGSKFSQFDRLTNHFDLWPYINDSQSILNTLYKVKSSDLTLTNLKNDKLGPKTLLKMINDKKFSGTKFDAGKGKLMPLSGIPMTQANLQLFSSYAIKWSLLNYIRCFNTNYTFTNKEKLLEDFADLSSSFSYDFSKFDESIEESKTLLSQLSEMIEIKTEPQMAITSQINTDANSAALHLRRLF